MPRKIFYDTEFIDNGTAIELISIGAVDDAGREFYAVSREFDPADCNSWVQENVLPLLPPRSECWSRADIASGLLDFLAPTGDHRDLELWAYYCAYDHVALAQLWGPMLSLPRGVPMFTHELMQLWEQAGRPEKPVQVGAEHVALSDARWNRDLHNACMRSGHVQAQGER